MNFGKTLAGFPTYFAQYIYGFVYGILCDVTLTSLAIASGALGWATDWRVGVATFFGGHFAIRLTNAKGEATVGGSKLIGGAINRLSLVIQPPPTEDETPGA